MGGGGEDEEEGEEEEQEEEKSPTCLSSIPDIPILLEEEEEEEEEQGFGEEIGRGIGVIQGIDIVSMENSSHGGSERGSGGRSGRGRSLQLFPRPTRKELVHLYLLRKRGLDKRCQDHLATWETTPHDCGMDLVSASLDSTGAQEKRSRMLLDDDEQDMSPSKRLRNRIKAQKARDRKMVNLKNLELKVEALEKNNAELEESCSILQNDNQMLRNEVMEGNSSGKEELMRYYEGLEKEIKEDISGKCDKIIDDELLEHDNGETLKSSNIVESSGHHVDNGEPFVGMKFESEMFAREFYAEYAWNLGFVTRTDKCRRSEKDGAIIWRKFVCSKEGFTRTKEKPNDGKSRRHRPSTRTGCPAFIEVTRKNDGQWAITKFHEEHNHRMFGKESDEWLLSNISLQENGINGGSVVGKEELEVKSEVAEPSDTQLNVNEPYEGMIFVSEETAKQFYKEYGRQKGFAIRTDKCRHSEKNGAIIWWRFTCSKEGLFSIKENGDDQKKRRRIRFSTRTGCLALLEITRKKDGNWTVSKFQRDHNHILSTTGEVHYCQYPRHILVDVRKGKSEDGFIGFLGKMQKMKDINGNDVHCLVAYLRHKQVDDPTFFFKVQAEKEEKLLNIVWVDARAYMAYSYFGDVLKVERSYTNYHYVPIVLLSGVNHHHQRVIFGCALLMDVNEESLEWLFTTWLRAMGGRHPASVITDRDPILEAAVLKVLPNVHHRFDHWHILTQCKEKMPALYKKNSTFKKELKDCVIHSESPEEFEPKWEKLVDGYNLGSNEWIRQLYETRKQWIPAFQRGTFFGELNIAMKTEPFEKLFGFDTHPRVDLHHLFLQCDRVVDSLYEEEKQADSKSVDITPCLRTHSPLESQAAQVYTNEVFEVFQEHFADAFAFKVVKMDDRSDGGSTYRLERYVRPGNLYTVQLRASETVASCSCRMFEFSGVPCSHVLAVLLFVQRPTLPDHYILRRWTKMANRGSDLDKTGGVR